ncbi:MAG: GspH/FimT family pseudopilin [Deltaproteobacteria bacterium]|nr:GspH/FimT family pseudopilin [Deltaproteobacteria bacterium]
MKRRPSHGRECAGFTIIEVLVTCVIIAVMGSITIAGFAVWLPGYRLKGAVREMYSNLNQAKIQAIKQHGRVDVTFSTSPSHRYTVPGQSEPIILADRWSGVLFAGESGQTFGPPSTITFDSRGRSNQTGNWFVYLSNDKNSAYYRLRVQPAGLVTIEKYDGGWPP